MRFTSLALFLSLVMSSVSAQERSAPGQLEDSDPCKCHKADNSCPPRPNCNTSSRSSGKSLMNVAEKKAPSKRTSTTKQ